MVSTARLANADTSSPIAVELAWDVPDACPGAQSVRRRIAQILGGPLDEPTNVEAKGTVEPTPDGRYRLVMAVRTGDVEDVRTVTAERCAMLAEAFAIVVALAIDPSKAVDGIDAPAPEASVGAVPASAAPLAVPATRESAAHRHHASPPPVHLAVGIGGDVVWGPLPDASVGAMVLLGAHVDRFRVGALATVSPSQDTHLGGGAGVSFGLLGAGAFVGYLVPVGKLALGPVVGVEVTQVRARAFGIRTPWSPTAAWWTPTLGGQLEAHAARWLGLFTRADLVLPIEAPVFSLATDEGALRLHSPGKVSARLSLGLQILFP